MATDLEIEIGLNTETKTIGKVLSSDITVTGDTFKYLNSIFLKTAMLDEIRKCNH